MAVERAVLVTGASSGFGRALVERLAGAGWGVSGTSRRADVAPDVLPAGVHPVAMDVDDDSSVEAGVAATLARWGRIDAVVANAGFGLAGALEDTTSQEAFAQFQTNFFGVHRLVRTALPSLRAARGRVVVVGSLGGRVGLPFQGMYAASKFALEGYCEALASEVAPFGVRVSLVEPGDFATGFTAARRRAAAAGEGSAYRAAFEAALAVVEHDETHGGDPSAVAALVTGLLARDPSRGGRAGHRLRHPVGGLGQRLAVGARAVVPDRLFLPLVAGHYRGRA